MKNISVDKRPVELKPGVKYIVMDAMYINEIRRELSGDTLSTLDDILERAFPYTDTPLARYTSEGGIFEINKIKKINDVEIGTNNSTIFSTDSGIIVLANEKIFIDFASKFDYDELVDHPTELLNTSYWRSIAKQYDVFDLAIIVSPGINSGIEFEGSGLYQIL